MYDAEGGRTIMRNIKQRYTSHTMLLVHDKEIWTWVTNDKGCSNIREKKTLEETVGVQWRNRARHVTTKKNKARGGFGNFGSMNVCTSYSH